MSSTEDNPLKQSIGNRRGGGTKTRTGGGAIFVSPAVRLKGMFTGRGGDVKEKKIGHL